MQAGPQQFALQKDSRSPSRGDAAATQMGNAVTTCAEIMIDFWNNISYSGSLSDEDALNIDVSRIKLCGFQAYTWRQYENKEDQF
jgi:hypothetical protein